MRKPIVFVVLTMLGAGLTTQALGETVQFSATVVESSPRGTMSSKLYVGDQATRTEKTYRGDPRITIIDLKKRVKWTLNPERKEYVEERGPAQSGQQVHSSRPPMPNEPESPCQQRREDFRCKMLGEETMNGRPVQKWEFASSQEGSTLRSLVWIDPELRMPVRQEFPDGSIMELRMMGEEDVSGRRTRKWESVTTRQGETRRSFMWIDPKLPMPVRQERPGGFSIEFRDIQEGPQSASLFAIPDGYTKKDMPAPTRGYGGPSSGESRRY